MEREIKFRALKDDMSNCNFVYGQLVYDVIGQPRITEVDKSGLGLTFHSCLKGTEGQFTGLKDKNGVDIYEGDIVDYGNGRNREVEFIEGCFCICGITAMPRLMINYKIIGNIHENPELL